MNTFSGTLVAITQARKLRRNLEVVPADSANCLTGVISNLEFMGHEVNLHVRRGTAVFVAVIPSERFGKTLKRGERAGLTALGPRIHLFDTSTGENVSLAPDDA